MTCVSSWHIRIPMIGDFLKDLLREKDTGWRRSIGCLQLQVIFRKRATDYRAFLRKMTYEDKASYGSSPPCIADMCEHVAIRFMCTSTHMCTYTHRSLCVHILTDLLRGNSFSHPRFCWKISHRCFERSHTCMSDMCEQNVWEREIFLTHVWERSILKDLLRGNSFSHKRFFWKISHRCFERSRTCMSDMCEQNVWEREIFLTHVWERSILKDLLRENSFSHKRFFW